MPPAPGLRRVGAEQQNGRQRDQPEVGVVQRPAALDEMADDEHRHDDGDQTKTMFTIRLRCTASSSIGSAAAVCIPCSGAGSQASSPGPKHLLAQPAERVRQLARDHPDLVRVALRELRQHLQVLVGEELRVGIALVDRPEHGPDRLRLALGRQDRGLPLALGLQDRRLLVALGGEDRGLLDPLGLQDRGALLALGADLLLHRVLDRGRRIDRLQLDPVDADAPLAGRAVEDPAQLVVHLVARGERLVERHRADHVAERRHREQVDRREVVGDLVRRRLRVGDLEVDDRLDVHDDVVLRDHGLRRERDDLLAQIEQRAHAVDERDDDGEARVQRPAVAAEPLDHAGARLRNHPHRLRQRDENDDGDNSDHDQRDAQGRPLFSIRRPERSRPGSRRPAPELPSSNTWPSTYVRAVQSSPPIRISPSIWSTRRSTTALRPTSAAVPVRAIAGRRRCLRAIGRSSASESTEPTTKTISAARPPAKAPDDGSGSRGERERAEQEHAGGQHLADDEPGCDQRPEKPTHTAQSTPLPESTAGSGRAPPGSPTRLSRRRGASG